MQRRPRSCSCCTHSVHYSHLLPLRFRWIPESPHPSPGVLFGDVRGHLAKAGKTQKDTTNLPTGRVLHQISPSISRLTRLHEALSRHSHYQQGGGEPCCLCHGGKIGPGTLFDLKNEKLLVCNEPIGKKALRKSRDQIEVQTVGAHIYTTYAAGFVAHSFHTVRSSKSTCTTRSPIFNLMDSFPSFWIVILWLFGCLFPPCPSNRHVAWRTEQGHWARWQMIHWIHLWLIRRMSVEADLNKKTQWSW